MKEKLDKFKIIDKGDSDSCMKSFKRRNYSNERKREKKEGNLKEENLTVSSSSSDSDSVSLSDETASSSSVGGGGGFGGMRALSMY